MEPKDFTSIFSFKLENENGGSVSFIGQHLAFKLSIKKF